MALTVKKITLWRTEVENKPGALASVLGPLADAGADLQILMGYRYPGNESKAAIEVYPVARKKVVDAASTVGLRASAIPTLLAEGDNKPGLGKVMTEAMAGAGINLSFMVTQVIGKRYSCIIGFENEADVRKAAGLIKKVTARKKK